MNLAVVWIVATVVLSILVIVQRELLRRLWIVNAQLLQATKTLTIPVFEHRRERRAEEGELPVAWYGGRN